MRGLFFLFLYIPVALARESLNLCGWAGTIPPEVIKQFENETGIEVTFDFFSQNEILEAKLLTGNSNYDIVFPSTWPYVKRQIEVGMYQPLQKDKIPNLRRLDPLLMKRLEDADPHNQYAVPFVWGTVVIGYNKAQIHRLFPGLKITGYDAIFEKEIISKLAQCRVYMYASPVEIFSTLLVYLGYPPASSKEDHIQDAIKLLRKVRPYIARFDSTRTSTDLANGDACLAIDLSSEVAIAQNSAKSAGKGVEIDVITPKKGTFLWVDTIVIPENAPHPDNAHKFINFLLRPEIIAQTTNATFSANAVKASRPFIDPEILNNPLVFPDERVIEKAHIGTVASPEHERRLMRELIKIMTDR